MNINNSNFSTGIKTMKIQYIIPEVYKNISRHSSFNLKRNNISFDIVPLDPLCSSQLLTT